MYLGHLNGFLAKRGIEPLGFKEAWFQYRMQAWWVLAAFLISAGANNLMEQRVGALLLLLLFPSDGSTLLPTSTMLLHVRPRVFALLRLHRQHTFFQRALFILNSLSLRCTNPTNFQLTFQQFLPPAGRITMIRISNALTRLNSLEALHQVLAEHYQKHQ